MAETQMGSRWLVCSTPARDKWHTVFQISGFTALWRMCHGCQKTIKKPLWGNAFANPAPDTATGCTLAYESGMHQPQPWSCKDSPVAGMHPGPCPTRRFCIWFFILTSEGFGSRKSSATFFHGFHITAGFWEINAWKLYNYSCINCAYLQCRWVSGAGPAHTATCSAPAPPTRGKVTEVLYKQMCAVWYAGIPLSPQWLLGASNL